MKRNKMEQELKNTEMFAERIKKAFEDQIDVDEKFSGFEFTLSKIEDILADEKVNDESKIQMNENSSKSIIAEINREDFPSRNNLRVSRRKSNVHKGLGSKVDEQTQTKIDDVELKVLTNENMETLTNEKIDVETQTMQRKITRENFEICDGEAPAIELDETVCESETSNLPKRRVSDPLSDWLLQLSSDPISDQNSTGRPSAYTSKDFNRMTSALTPRPDTTAEKVNNEEQLGNDQLKDANNTTFFDWDLFEANEDRRLSGIISDAAEMTNEINMYIKVESEIESVKSEIEKRQLSKNRRMKKKTYKNARGTDHKDDKIQEKRGKTSQNEISLSHDNVPVCEDILPVARNISSPPAGQFPGLTKVSKTTSLLRGETKEGSTMFTGVTKQMETQAAKEIDHEILPLISKPPINLNPFCIQCQPYYQHIYYNPFSLNCYHSNQPLRLGSSEQPGSFCNFHKIFEETSTPIQKQIMCFCSTDQGVMQKSVLAELDENKLFDRNMQIGCLTCNKATTHRLPLDKCLQDTLKIEDARKCQDGKTLERIKSEMSFDTETSSDSGYCVQDGSAEKPESNNESKEMMNYQGVGLEAEEAFATDLQPETHFTNKNGKDTLNKENFTKTSSQSQSVDQENRHKASKEEAHEHHNVNSCNNNYNNNNNNTKMEASAAGRNISSFSKGNGEFNDGNESITSDEELDQRLGNLFEEFNQNEQRREEYKTGSAREQDKREIETYGDIIKVGPEQMQEEGDSESIRKIQRHKSKEFDRTNKTPKHQKFIKEACNSLEVQIASGYDENRYGDSFLSPLVKDNSFDMVEDKESSDLTDDLGSLDVTTGNQCEDIVVKKSWSISNWLWGKRSKQHNIEEVSVVIQ